MSNLNISTGPVGEAEQTFTGMQAVVIDADAQLALAFAEQRMENDLPIRVEVEADATQLPRVLNGAQIAILARGALTADVARQCAGLLHVIFFSENARRASDTEALETLGITSHALGEPPPETFKALADAAIEQCRRIVSPTGG